MTEQQTYPDKKSARVSADLNNSIGFVCEEAERLYGLKNGKTALFWHLVYIVREHAKDD